MDHLNSRVVSLQGNKGAHVLTNGRSTKVLPMVLRSMAGDSLCQFSQDIGIPDCLITNLAGEHTGKCTELMQQVRCLDIDLTWSEKGCKNQNHKSEWEIRMIELSIPWWLWNYGLVYKGEILSWMCCHHDQ